MKILDHQQGTLEWLEARRGVPTSSEFSSICSAVKGEYSTGADGHINRLIGELYDPRFNEVEPYMSASMKNGQLLEPQARSYYEWKRSADVQQVGLCLDDKGRFGCSPDGLVGEEGGLECKCPAAKTHVGYLRAGTLPDAYKQQVHGSLIVTGRDWWDFLSYCEGLPPLLIRVTPNEYTKKLRRCLNRFWGHYQRELNKIIDLHGPPSCWAEEEEGEPVEDTIIF